MELAATTSRFRDQISVLQKRPDTPLLAWDELFRFGGRFYATEAVYSIGSLVVALHFVAQANVTSRSFSSLGIVHTEQCLYYVASCLFYHKQNQKYS